MSFLRSGLLEKEYDLIRRNVKSDSTLTAMHSSNANVNANANDCDVRPSYRHVYDRRAMANEIYRHFYDREVNVNEILILTYYKIIDVNQIETYNSKIYTCDCATNENDCVNDCCCDANESAIANDYDCANDYNHRYYHHNNDIFYLPLRLFRSESSTNLILRPLISLPCNFSIAFSRSERLAKQTILKIETTLFKYNYLK